MEKPESEELTVMDALCVVGFAENGTLGRTGKALHTVRQNVKYHLKRVNEKTGKDPRNPQQLAELLPLAHAIVERERRAEML